MKRLLVISIPALVAVGFLLGCAGGLPLLHAEAAADGKVTAGPVVIAGVEVAPRFDVVDGIATVVVQSVPPYLTINLDPRASFAASLSEAQAKAINEGRVAIFRTSQRMGITSFPVRAAPKAPGCSPVAMAVCSNTVNAVLCADGACVPPPTTSPCEPPRAAPCLPAAPPPCLAKAAPSTCGQPVYVAPHCLPKIDPASYAQLNDFLCNITKWAQSILPPDGK